MSHTAGGVSFGIWSPGGRDRDRKQDLVGIMQILGGLCILFGVVDILAPLVFDYDITGVTWSPIVAFILGSILFKIGGGGDD